jgi:hypothetical protein
MSERSEKQTEQTELEKVARHYRHIGFAIFGGLAAFLAGILAYSAITAYLNNEAYDPVTGKNVMGGPEHPALQQVAETH